MAGGIVQAQGLGKFLRFLKDAGDKTIPKQIRRAGLDVVTEMAGEMRERAPKVKQKLAGTIRPMATQRMAKVQIGRGIDYAKPVIFGTGPRKGKRGPHNIAKHKFPYEVLEEHRGSIVAEYGGAIEQALKEAST